MDWALITDPHPTAVYSVKDLEYREWEQLKDSELVLQVSQADMEQMLVVNLDRNKTPLFIVLKGIDLILLLPNFYKHLECQIILNGWEQVHCLYSWNG